MIACATKTYRGAAHTGQHEPLFSELADANVKSVTLSSATPFQNLANVYSMQIDTIQTPKANPKPAGDPKHNLARILPGFT